MKVKRFASLLFFCLFPTLLSGCGSTNESTAEDATVPVLDCPFTDLGWDSTIEDVISAEGNDYTTYDSVYGGTCYTYPKEYTNYDGRIKYMFDDEDQLMCVAWSYGSDDSDQLYELYNTINNNLIDIYGESGYDANSVGNYGNVWYLESGDIILSTMITSDNKALQYAYYHPQVSNSASTEK